jgi:catechol 2,3-dioxygenase-like lactoylglutathione lyase family enzyme
MFDHVLLKVRDLEASSRFYAAALEPLGVTVIDRGDGYVGLGTRAAEPALWLFAGEPTPGHLAFASRSRMAVDAFYAAAIAHGGSDHGQPGPRPEYHAHYYGAFVLDPDGNNVEAVCQR